MRTRWRGSQRGSDRSYAFAAAVANPILVAALARVIGGTPVGERRVVLGAVAYAIPYVAMWSIVGWALAGNLRRLELLHGGDAPGMIRTCDLCLRRAALYPLSYGRGGALV